MSYKDIKNFCEMARVLGYPRLISIENFRQPNFALLAELLKWLVKRYDPHVDLPVEIETESDRILFVKSVAQFMATKAHIKLNTKKLYQADGTVVKELLKMTSVLYNALKLNSESENQEESLGSNFSTAFDISSQIGDLRRARELASEITGKGASIYDFLVHEVDLRDLRNYTINRNLELSEVENGINYAIKACRVEQEKTKTNLENIHLDEKNLDDKIEKKKADLERNRKRLGTLKGVRPAYMDDYESYEKELELLYEEYLVKFRIQSYLEQQLDEYNQSEQEKFEDSARRMQMTIKKMKDQEKERNGNPFMDNDDEMMMSADSDQSDDKLERNGQGKLKMNAKQRNVAGGKTQNEKSRNQMRNFGTMDADLSGSDDEEGDGLDDDDDDDDDDSDDDEEMEANEVVRHQRGQHALDDDDDDLQVGKKDVRQNRKAPNSTRKTVSQQNESDSDF